MDGLTMRRLTLELHQLLAGSKIEKIHQPANRDLVLLLRPPGQSAVRLLLSAHKQFARVHLLEDERPENPKEPPMFCMLLRKHIEGGRIVAIEQQGYDRVVNLVIEAYNEVGDLTTYYMICELMGRHSNIALCRQQDEAGALRIIDSIVRVTEAMSRYREVVPGAPYIAPPVQDKTPPDKATSQDIVGLDFTDLFSKSNAMLLVNHIAGIGPTSAREVLFRASQTLTRQQEQDGSATIATMLQSILASALHGTESASVALDPLGRATECAPFLLTHKGDYTLCPTISEAIRRRFADTGEVLYHSHLQDELSRVVLEHIDRLRGKRVKLEQSLADSEDESIYRIKAELLTAYAYQIEKGQSRVVLENYYDENQPIAIDLDPALDAIGNAQRYYKQATKRKRAAHSVTEQLEVTEMDMHYLENVEESLRDAGLEHLEQIRRELVSQGFLQEKAKQKRTQSKKVNKEKQDTQADAFLSSDGFTIRVGRNNLQNDRLTFRQSDAQDIWLHVKDQPGSHVVIRKDQHETIPESTVEEAALLAAYYSRGRDSANVPVDITEIRHVWKPNGARPGFALYDHQRTVFVTPDRSLVESLLANRATAPK